MIVRVTRKLPAVRKIARTGSSAQLPSRNRPRRAAVRTVTARARSRWSCGRCRPGSAANGSSPTRSPTPATVVYYLHGGGYVAGSPAMYRTLTGAFSRSCTARIFALDYRLAPEHQLSGGPARRGRRLSLAARDRHRAGQHRHCRRLGRRRAGALDAARTAGGKRAASGRRRADRALGRSGEAPEFGYRRQRRAPHGASVRRRPAPRRSAGVRAVCRPAPTFRR